MDTILDVYQYFLKSRDQYLGKIFVDLDPKKVLFGVLPSDFIITSLLSDGGMKKVVEIIFRKLLTAYENVTMNLTILLLFQYH